MNMQFCPDRLRAALEIKEITVQELAEGIDHTRQIVYRWLEGDGLPNMEAFQAMCDFLKLKPGYFFPETIVTKKKARKSSKELVSV